MIQEEHGSGPTGVCGRKPIPFGADEIEGSIPQRFAKVAGLCPDRPALWLSGKTVSYASLNKTINQLARMILDRADPGRGIGAILLGRESPQILAVFGLLQAGLAYLPLDPDLPLARLSFMLADAQAGLILTDDHHLALARELAKAERILINIDRIPEDISSASPIPAVRPEAMANIHYTSGSTGEPKGVVQNHRNTLHMARITAEIWPVAPGDRLAHIAPSPLALPGGQSSGRS